MARPSKHKSSSRKSPEPAQEFFRPTVKFGAILGVIGFLLYLPTMGHSYALDDANVITDNPLVQTGLRGIPGLFSVDAWFAANINLGYYRPLSLITFAIEQQFFGDQPSVSHFINAFLYGLIVFLVHSFLAGIFPQKGNFAFFTTLLFATHPIHTEVVANIKGRDELLSFLGLVASLWLLVKHLKSGKISLLLASLAASYLGFLSKETAFSMVFLAPLVVFFSSNQSLGKSAKWIVPYAIALALFMGQKYFFTHTLTGAVPDDILNYPYAKEDVKIPAAFLILFTSVRLLIFPHPLRYDYSYNYLPCEGWGDAGTLAGILVALVGAGFAARGLIGKTNWGFGAAFFFITIGPALMFVILRGGIMAERFLFAPSLGFAILVVEGAMRSAARLSKNMKSSSPASFSSASRVAFTIVALLCVAYSVKAVVRGAQWKNNTTLFSADIKTGETSAQNLRHFGDILTFQASRATDLEIQQNYSLQAIEALTKAIKIHPRFGEAHNKLGVNYHVFQEKIDLAIACYQKAIETAPGFPESYFNLGVAYHELGRSNVASFYYNQALERNPRYLEAAARAAEIKAATGLDVRFNPLTTPMAVPALDAANKDANYYFQIGNQNVASSDYNTAMENYRTAIQLDPGHENARINLANCLGVLERHEEAIKVLREVVAINSKNVSALKNLSVFYQKMGDETKSREWSQKAEQASRMNKVEPQRHRETERN